MKRVYGGIKVAFAALILGCIISVILLITKSEKSLTNATLTAGKEEDAQVTQVENVNKDSGTSIKTEDSSDAQEKAVKGEEAIEDKSNNAESQKQEVKKVYKLNDKGDEVLGIQRKLNKFGYKLNLDGVFGNGTYFAVMNFQQKVGLNPDGIVGEETMKKLELEPTEELMYKPKADSTNKTAKRSNSTDGLTQDASTQETFINSQNVSSATEYYIWVDTKNFSVNIFTGSTNNWKLLKSMKASIGAASTPTIKGKFNVESRGSMFRVNEKIICKYYTQFHGNYLFHSVLLDNNGKVVDGRLGMRISHGCIRLAIEDAKYIYENIPSATSVWVK